jgi:hypothetical protein
MRKKVSSGEAIKLLNKWQDAKSTVKALFMERDLMFSVTGKVMILPNESKVYVVVDPSVEIPKILVSFPVVGDEFWQTEPLLDASDDERWEMDFFVGISFPVFCGSVTLYELAE